MSQFRPAKRRVEVSVGESFALFVIARAEPESTGELTGIPQTTISAIENDRVCLG